MARIVEVNPAIPRPALTADGPGRARRWWRLQVWLAAPGRKAAAARARRVVLLIAMLSVVNGFDLAFTLLATRTGGFVELNPVAAGLVESAGALVAFKVLMVLFAFCIFFRFRRRLLTEIACWGLCGIYATLAGRWWTYYFLCHD